MCLRFYKRIRKAVVEDKSYAIGWIANLQMAAMDSGASRKVAVATAKRFMGWLFEYDINTNSLHIDVEKKWENK